MRLPKRREVFRFPVRIQLTEERLERVREFLRLEDYRDIRSDRLYVTASRGSAKAFLLPLREAKEKPHTIEVSLLEIRYTLDLWYISSARRDAWVFGNEAVMLQEFVSREKLPRLEADELKEKIAYTSLERYVDFGYRILLVALAGLFVALIIDALFFLFG